MKKNSNQLNNSTNKILALVGIQFAFAFLFMGALVQAHIGMFAILVFFITLVVAVRQLFKHESPIKGASSLFAAVVLAGLVQLVLLVGVRSLNLSKLSDMTSYLIAAAIMAIYSIWQIKKTK